MVSNHKDADLDSINDAKALLKTGDNYTPQEAIVYPIQQGYM
jgi:hypothetical protein